MSSALDSPMCRRAGPTPKCWHIMASTHQQSSARCSPDMYPPLVNHWIDDRDVPASAGASFEKRSPIDDRVIARVAAGTGADVTAAVDAAARASDSWRRVTAPARGAILGRA